MSPSPESGRNRLECRTCPYQCAIEAPLFSRRTFKKKEREDVFGGPGAWDNADKIAVQCPGPGCNGNEAAFYQLQIRSADEPMTSFFKVMQAPTSSSSQLATSVRVHGYSYADSKGAVHVLWTPMERELMGG